MNSFILIYKPYDTLKFEHKIFKSSYPRHFDAIKEYFGDEWEEVHDGIEDFWSENDRLYLDCVDYSYIVVRL